MQANFLKSKKIGFYLKLRYSVTNFCVNIFCGSLGFFFNLAKNPQNRKNKFLQNFLVVCKTIYFDVVLMVTL